MECLEGSATGDEVDYENDDSDDQEDVDQTARDMEAETEEPQNQENYKDSPKHEHVPFVIGEFECD